MSCDPAAAGGGSEPLARWLCGALLGELTTVDVPRIRSTLAGAADGGEIASVIAHSVRARPTDFHGEIDEAARVVAQETAAANAESLKRWRPLGEAFEEQRLRWAGLHGLSHLGTLYPTAGSRAIRTSCVLVHPYDAPRARVLLASRGMTTVSSERGPWCFRGDDIAVTIFDGLHPACFAAVPLSPFFEQTILDEATAVRRMQVGAAAAAHRLLTAQHLWDPGLADPLLIAEAAVLCQRAADDAGELWAERAARWRVNTLWRRAAEVDNWLLGGLRPAWLPAGYGSPAAPPRTPSLRQGLALQDRPSGMLGYLSRWLIRRALTGP